ncbi:MAG: hypothetical protein WCD76_09445 [Pyrinomonadaceae bacterium]
MRNCPKCGDYYADSVLAFCLNDGTPLVDVAPSDGNWSEGVRVIENKEHALRIQKRKLKWRRVSLGAMTVLMATVIVCVVVVNSLIYLQPKQEERVPAGPLVTPPTSPTPTPPVCSAADKNREKGAIVKKFGDTWRHDIEGERDRIIAGNVPVGALNAEANLGVIEYQSTFSEACTSGFIMARYAWQVRANVNGEIKVATVSAEKKFTCVKSGGAWLCR